MSRPFAPPAPFETDDIPAAYRRPFATVRTIAALIMREMSTTYGRSPGGYLWAILEPVGYITIMSLAFSFYLHSPPLGTNFLYFYASGYLPFTAYSDIVNKVIASIRFSRSLLAYPAVTYVDAVLARFVLAATTQAVVMILVLAGIVLIFDLQVIIRPGYVVLAFAMAAACALGVGMLNCMLSGLFPIWERLWGVLMKPLMLLSAVFYTFESLGSQIQWYFWFNPVVHMVGAMRAGLFIIYDPSYVSPAYVFGLALSCLVIGLLFMNRYHREIINGR